MPTVMGWEQAILWGMSGALSRPDGCKRAETSAQIYQVRLNRLKTQVAPPPPTVLILYYFDEDGDGVGAEPPLAPLAQQHKQGSQPPGWVEQKGDNCPLNPLKLNPDPRDING